MSSSGQLLLVDRLLGLQPLILRAAALVAPLA